MKNLWKKWIFLAQFHLPDADPDPVWQFESGSETLGSPIIFTFFLNKYLHQLKCT